MKEHRLIERMVKLAGVELEKVRNGKEINPRFIDLFADFMKNYADKCHHGKEEKILFREMEGKKLDKEDAGMVEELKREHVMAREKVGALVNAKERVVAGDGNAREEMTGLLVELVELYPQHIDKEDGTLFLRSMDYFTEKEQEKMTVEFEEFDQNMIHWRYGKMVADLGG